MFKGLGSATVYFKTADEAVAQKTKLGNHRFRVEGTVVDGTVRQTGNDVAFTITNNNVDLAVVNQGSPPELFKPEIPVVLEGRWSGDHFASDRIIVKHSETYRAQHQDRVKDYFPPNRESGSRFERRSSRLGRAGWRDAGCRLVDQAQRALAQRPHLHVDDPGCGPAGRVRHAAGPDHPRLLAAVRRRQRQPLDAAAVHHHRHVVGAGRVDHPLAVVLAGYLTVMQVHFRKRSTDPLVGWATLTGLSWPCSSLP